jgi:competence protein ComGC
MNNKKGFTLVELLAILGLLTIIILLGMPLLINQIESQKKKNYENFVGDLCLATESYINHNTNIDGINEFRESGDTIQISIGDLMSNGYVKSNTKNPKTNESLTSTDSITVTLTEDMTYNCVLNSVVNNS